MALCQSGLICRFKSFQQQFGGKLAMTTPVNKITRFEDRTEVFQYSKDDDWLLASPQTTPNNRRNARVNQIRLENEITVIQSPQSTETFPVEEILADDPEIANILRQYNSIKKQRTDEKMRNQEQESQRERAERARQEEIRKANEAEQLRALEEAKRQDQLKKEAEIQRFRELQERERQEKAAKERMEAPSMEIQSQVPQKTQNPPRQGERVTLGINEWLKMAIGQPEIVPQQPQHQINPDKPRNSTRANRVTLDLKAISSMFTENYNKYENISNKRQTLSRKSLSYRTSTNPNFVAFDRYFQSLEAQPTEAEVAEEKYFADMEEQSERRLRESQAKMAKLQQEIRALQAELASIPDELAQTKMELSKFESCLEPIKKFYYNLRIKILQIETNQLDPYFIYCEFILDEDMFFKLRREDSSKPAEILTMYNSVLDVIPGDALIDVASKIEMLRIYFAAKLDRLPSYQLLQQLGAYYGQLKELQDDLARLSSIFSIRSMEMSRSYEKLTFELAIHPNTTVLVTLKLMQLMEPNYYEFYHIETSRDIIVPEERMMGDDLIDIIEAMSECL